MRRKLGRIFVLWLPIMAVLWLGSSTIFWLLQSTVREMTAQMMMIKSMINYGLSIASFVGIFLFLIGLVLLSKKSKSGSYISQGRKLAKKNFKQYRKPLLLVAVISVIIGFLQETYGVAYTDPITDLNILNTTGKILNIFSIIFGILYGIGFIKLGLQAEDEEKKFTIKTLLVHKWSEIWKLIISQLTFIILLIIPALLTIGILIFGSVAISGNHGLNIPLGGAFFTSFGGNLGIGGGAILLILGIVLLCYIVYYGMRISMVLRYVAIDHNNLSPWGMIKRSWKISKGKVMLLFSVGFIAGLTNVLGVLALGIGLLWTIPLTLIATAKVYQDVDKEYSHKEKFENISE